MFTKQNLFNLTFYLKQVLLISKNEQTYFDCNFGIDCLESDKRFIRIIVWKKKKNSRSRIEKKRKVFLFLLKSKKITVKLFASVLLLFLFMDKILFNNKKKAQNCNYFFYNYKIQNVSIIFSTFWL